MNKGGLLDRLLGRGHVEPVLDMDAYEREVETMTDNVNAIRELVARRERRCRQELTAQRRRHDDACEGAA